MKLYTRLVVSYGYLVTLVLVGAAGAAFGFHSLGSRIGTVLSANFESVRASTDMIEALERQDSAVLQGLLSPDDAPAEVAESEDRFLEALGRARAHATEDREALLLDTIRERFEDCRQARDALLRSRPGRPLARYEAEFVPTFEAVKTAVRDLHTVNHEAMVRADRETQEAATERAIGYGALTAVALVSLGVLSRQLRRHVIAPLDDLRAVTAAVEGGDLRRRAAEDGGGDLGDIARELNRLLDEQERLRGHFRSRVAEMRGILGALVRASGEEATLVALGGEIITTTLDETAASAIADRCVALRESLESGTDDDGRFESSVTAGDTTYRVRLLRDRSGRPLAWLAGS